MKLLKCMLLVAGLTFGTFSVFADTSFGVVDMQNVFQNAAQVKKINATLKTQFKAQKEEIDTMGKQLQGDMQKYEKDKTIMSASHLTSLQEKITQEETTLRNAQTKFQQDLFQAQNQAMMNFMNQLRNVIKSIAIEKKLDVVLPKNTILYSKDSTDITAQVVNELS